MTKTRFLVMAIMVTVAVIVAKAQQRDVRADYSFHGDVAEITTHEVGQLEKVFTPESEKRVRALNIEGPINGADIKFLQRILKRGGAEDQNGRSISNYVDLDLRYARIVGGGPSYYSYYRTEHDVIGNSMFVSCSHLRSVVLPERTRSIGNDAFRYCSALTEVKMPRDVRSVGDHAFAGCYNLNRIVLPDGVETLGDGCFDGCTSLRDLQLPRGLMSLGEKALDNVPLTVMRLPATTRIEKNSPGFMPNLTAYTVESGSRYYTYEDGVLFDVTGEVLLLYPPKRGGNYTVPEGVTRLEASAFRSCSNLASVTMPASVVEVGDNAFASCASLRQVTFPLSLKRLGSGVFEGCKALAYCRYPASLTDVPAKTFKDCASLASVDLPASVATIAREAFKSSGLQAVSLPSTVTLIEEDAFRGCKALAAVELGDNMRLIGKGAFRDCDGLRQLSITAASIIEKEAFRGCKSLAAINLPSQLTTIGDNAFRETAITTLDLPASVTDVGNKIAEKCKNLQTIIVRRAEPPALGKVSNNKVKLVVPAGSEDAYKAANHWKEFKQIVADE